jgi:hypothetical protein
MRTVRRLYIYAVAGVTLLIAAIGAVNLLGIGIDALFRAVTDRTWIEGEPDWQRERLSLFVPFVVIATPIWFLHWRMAQRAVHGDDAVAERRSLVRAIYFMVLLLASLQAFFVGLTSVIDLGLRDLLGASLQSYERDSLITSLSVVLVVTAIWLFHIATYRQDVRTETEETRGALPPQLYLYMASAIGAIMLLTGTSDLIRLGVDALADVDRFGRWWRDPLANGVSLVVTGGLLWTVHWRGTERELATSTWWGRSERGSTLRRLYLVAILVIAAIATLATFASGIEGIARLVLDVPVPTHDSHLSEIAGPLLATIPFGVFWFLHRQRFMAEPSGVGAPMQPVSATRLLEYTMAFLGLLFASGGVAALLGEVVQAIAGEDGWRSDVGWPAGAAIGGGLLWAWYWWSTRRRFAQDTEAEQISTTRRAYLFVVLGGTIVAFIVGLAMTVYQVLQQALDVSGAGDLASEIALPLGITVVTLGVALYHGLLLRRDLPVRGLMERGEAVGRERVEVVLTGPEGADLAAMVDTLRRTLPEGYDLST